MADWRGDFCSPRAGGVPGGLQCKRTAPSAAFQGNASTCRSPAVVASFAPGTHRPPMLTGRCWAGSPPLTSEPRQPWPRVLTTTLQGAGRQQLSSPPGGFQPQCLKDRSWAGAAAADVAAVPGLRQPSNCTSLHIWNAKGGKKKRCSRQETKSGQEKSWGLPPHPPKQACKGGNSSMQGSGRDLQDCRPQRVNWCQSKAKSCPPPLKNASQAPDSPASKEGEARIKSSPDRASVCKRSGKNGLKSRSRLERVNTAGPPGQPRVNAAAKGLTLPRTPRALAPPTRQAGPAPELLLPSPERRQFSTATPSSLPRLI